MDSNYIIKPSDPRYELLDKIFSDNSYENNISKESKNSIYYYIPKELVLNEYVTKNVKVLKNPNPDRSSWDNWVYRQQISEYLNYCCNLTTQEYYDLCILHINNKLERPKCIECGSILPFSDRLSRGYGKRSRLSKYCSTSCQLTHMIKNTDILVRSNYMSYLNSCSDLDNECYLYLFYSEKYIKFGITINIEGRKRIAHDRDNFNVISDEILFKGNILQCANIEAFIKLSLNKHDEYLENTIDNVELIKNIVNSIKDPNELPFPEYLNRIQEISKCTVIKMRFGAPDKINAMQSPYYKVEGHDNTNLIDYTDEELINISRSSKYILPADEGDIKRANLFKDNDPFIDQSFILLPLVDSKDPFGESLFHVINYPEFVPKNSKVYNLLEKSTGIIYPQYKLYTVEEFKRLSLDFINKEFYGKALKSTTGSGSRGVWLLDENRVYLGGKYVDHLNKTQLDSFISFCNNEGCDIMVQQLIPNNEELLKVNVDFVIRDGKLLGYKWDEVNQSQQFTNWDNFYIVRNEYTDNLMDKLVNYLTSLGITDAIMNFEAFSDQKSITYMIEFNWRFSNSMFELQALNQDIVASYLYRLPIEVPYGRNRACRYWQCKLYDDIPNYNSGK